MLNSGAISQINAQGTNQRSLQDLMNQYSGELATGYYDGTRTMEGQNNQQQFDLNTLLNPEILRGAQIGNDDAASQMGERKFGQLIALGQALKDNPALAAALPPGIFENFEALAEDFLPKARGSSSATQTTA